MNNNKQLQTVNLKKAYTDGGLSVTVLRKVNLIVNAKDKVAIIGRSGSGKSTLLHLLAGLDKPSCGEINIDGKKMHILSESERGIIRNQYLGFVYQFHHLLPEFTALENVAMPLLIQKNKVAIAYHQATTLLQKVGLKDRLKHRPSELSGGERQRVAIARALVNKPRYLLADEPTGNLDNENAQQIFDLLLTLNDAYNLSLILVTHHLEMAKKMDKIFELQNGILHTVSHSTIGNSFVDIT